MDGFGPAIKKLREDGNLPLRKVAAHLDIDQSILSKMENGLKRAKREQVVQLAQFFKTDESDLLVLWLAEKVVYEMQDEPHALRAMMVAEEQIKYQTQQKK